jgi:hypothetical protein
VQDGYCHNDTSSGVQVLSYVNVTQGDENALKVQPLSISPHLHLHLSVWLDGPTGPGSANDESSF